MVEDNNKLLDKFVSGFTFHLHNEKYHVVDTLKTDDNDTLYIVWSWNVCKKRRCYEVWTKMKLETIINDKLIGKIKKDT